MATITQPVLCNAFAAGSSGAGIPAGPGGGVNNSLGTPDGALFDTVITTGGTLTYDSAHAYSGALSCKVATSAASTCAALWTGAGMIINVSAQLWYRLYLYQAAWPGTLHPVFNVQVSGTKSADVVLNTNGTLSVRDANSTVIVTTTNTVPNNGWYRIEGYVTSSATTGQVELKLFNSPGSPTPTETQTSAASQNTLGGNLNQARFGCATGAASGLTWWMADVALSASGYIGPGPVVFHLAARRADLVGVLRHVQACRRHEPATEGRHRPGANPERHLCGGADPGHLRLREAHRNRAEPGHGVLRAARRHPAWRL